MSAQEFHDPFYDSYQVPGSTFASDENALNVAYGGTNPNSIWSKIGDFFGDDNKLQYDNWKSYQDRLYDRASTNSARAWEEWFDSTAVQRRVQDIEKAGLNPWLALQSGGIGANGSSSVSTGNSAKQQDKTETKSNTLGYLLLAAAKVICALL